MREMERRREARPHFAELVPVNMAQAVVRLVLALSACTICGKSSSIASSYIVSVIFLPPIFLSQGHSR